ncbi:MAG: insulinase family protein [Gammaproteobacteria bacterium]|nr:insulinase family protein [Gammaproteobacteria bacterium]
MLRPAILLTCTSVLLAACGDRASTSSVAGPIPRLEYEKYTLPNGLDVILVEDHRLPLVAVNLWYHVGPANERPGRTGFAHLFEHMMFQGSRHVGSDRHIQRLEAAGASEINGTTDFDRTNYFETLPSNQLELALWMESDRMGFLLDTLDQQELTGQIDVVRNERRQSIENAPYGLVEEEIFHQLFPAGHPYYASVIGSHADLEAARLEDVRAFFREYYAPNNASLAIVGDIDKARTRALVEKYFGPLAAGQPVSRPAVATPPISAEKRVTVSDKVELPRVYLAWLTAPIYQPGDAEADLLAALLGGGKSSRLYKDLVYEKKIAQDVAAQQYSLTLGSVFIIQATAKPGITPAQLEAAIDAQLARLRAEGPTQAELERARNTIETRIMRGLESLGGFGGVADRLNQYNHHLGNPGYLAEDIGRYRAATPASLRDVAARTLTPAARVVVVGVPGEKRLQDVPRRPLAAGRRQPLPADAAEWRAVPPAAAPASNLSLPMPQRFTLPNGLDVLLLEQHQLPVFAASLYVLRGSEANPPQLPGLAAFTADMLDEGTTTRPALRLADDVAQIGATLAAGSSSDRSAVSIAALRRNADSAFALLADVALHPAFAATEIERLRDERLTSLLQERDDVRALAERVFNRTVYGPDHPYGHTEIGSEAALKALTRADLERFWKAGYVPGNAALVVSGDLTLAELRKLAEKHFGQWSGSSSAVQLPPVPAATGRTLVIVDQPGAPQTALRIGQVGVPRSSPDYVALEVMNTELGGLFSSRINLNLREQHGYTYGAGSRFAFRRGPGPFYVSTAVRADATAPAVREIFKEIERMRATPVTDAELSLARDSFARSLAGLFETTSQSVGSIGEIYVYGLPLDYYGTLPASIEAVSAADVQRVARQYLTPEKMAVVAAGDRRLIAPGLVNLRLGPVELRDFDGNAITTPPGR